MSFASLNKHLGVDGTIPEAKAFISTEGMMGVADQWLALEGGLGVLSACWSLGTTSEVCVLHRNGRKTKGCKSLSLSVLGSQATETRGNSRVHPSCGLHHGVQERWGTVRDVFSQVSPAVVATCRETSSQSTGPTRFAVAPVSAGGV